MRWLQPKYEPPPRLNGRALVHQDPITFKTAVLGALKGNHQDPAVPHELAVDHELPAEGRHSGRAELVFPNATSKQRRGRWTALTISGTRLPAAGSPGCVRMCLTPAPQMSPISPRKCVPHWRSPGRTKGTQQWCAALRLYGHLRTCTESDVRKASAVGRAEGAGSVRVNSPQYALVRRRLTRSREVACGCPAVLTLDRRHQAFWFNRACSVPAGNLLRWTRTAEIPLLNNKPRAIGILRTALPQRCRATTTGRSSASSAHNRVAKRYFEPFSARDHASLLPSVTGSRRGTRKCSSRHTPRARSRTTFSMFFDWIRITPQARARSKGRRSSPDQ